jgi:hypothetical protein
MLLEALGVSIAMVTAGACSHPLTSTRPVAQILSDCDADGRRALDEPDMRAGQRPHSEGGGEDSAHTAFASAYRFLALTMPPTRGREQTLPGLDICTLPSAVWADLGRKEREGREARGRAKWQED